jgi:hypothetical protein
VGAYSQGQTGQAREGHGCYARDDPSLEGERSRKRLEEVAQGLGLSLFLSLDFNLHKIGVIIRGGTFVLAYHDCTLSSNHTACWPFYTFALSTFLQRHETLMTARLTSSLCCFRVCIIPMCCEFVCRMLHSGIWHMIEW